VLGQNEVVSAKTMNILFVNSIRMWGGAEVWTHDVMRALEERGHVTHLICRPHTDLETKTRQARLSVYPMNMHSDFGLLAIFRIMRFIRAHRIEIICTNMQKELRFAGIAAELMRTAVVAWRHIDQPLKNNWRYRFTYNFCATCIAANSNATRDSLLKNAPWLKRERIAVIYNGIDPIFFANGDGAKIRRAYGLCANTPLIGFVGLLDERKGIQFLLEAFAPVCEEIPDARLLLVGEGNLREHIEVFRQHHDFGRRLFLAGFQPNIADFMNAFDLLVLPSLWEGFGYVLVEAMAAGKPVIATNTSSMPEIVRDGVDGLLVPPGDVQALSQAIARLLQNPQLAKQMGENGKKRVEEKFTKERMIEEIEALFASLIRRNCHEECAALLPG
jgi:glycosyltransferase involved in cell wall biosynthesis